MARPDKAAAVAEVADLFRESSAAILTEYRGLSVGQLQTLRRSLGADTTYAVVKNTLAEIAAKEAGVDAFHGELNGPTAIAFIKGEPVEPAKAMRDFAKENPQLIVKSGYFEGSALTADDVKKLADLESREVLLAKAAGALKASMSKAAAVFNAPLTKTARTVDALRAKNEDA
ncbi:50S ribosomal protein L10 [Helcobacillus massiliensis]|uniref:Large ribosomal subunit protein uL10 n=1 Tax=Helcobacillus massiliensis TaxID=521392 RepID=A0A839QYD5_9MICO|nr:MULTISPECIES: 50S ribosomal protein L10 [Helcobacillus]MBB3022961.1 large subunit ribosomal protein L10 [Helcobacillus massiliensis]MCG7426190.1 50S ribosomal protein L10 [Helcobacillus sp. ACRRO]MCT1558317.1 50S ribosomal protein L10 [Helcobacillus massiliensis]MCT2037334.1 50S ribosomal protein L10 [Helcobacillus massiliensis]MCT2332354.1 50S ribosomal protein L10 [Helcobacillus massiliensis]